MWFLGWNSKIDRPYLHTYLNTKSICKWYISNIVHYKPIRVIYCTMLFHVTICLWIPLTASKLFLLSSAWSCYFSDVCLPSSRTPGAHAPDLPSKGRFCARPPITHRWTHQPAAVTLFISTSCHHWWTVQLASATLVHLNQLPSQVNW